METRVKMLMSSITVNTSTIVAPLRLFVEPLVELFRFFAAAGESLGRGPLN